MSVSISFMELWKRISRIGVDNQPYAEARRIILSNQIALLGVITPQFYNLFYALHDFRMLLSPILVNTAGSFICAVVLLLNYFHHHRLAKFTVMLSPNVQIFLLTYYLSTASGMHLLHIMMISFVLFLLSNEKKSVIALVSVIPVALYVIAYVMFTPEVSPIILDANILIFFYITISLTVFLLVMLFFALFYKEILYTEKLLQNEYERSESLLLSILPEEVAQRLKSNPELIADTYPSVTILFADIVGFTGIASSIEPGMLVKTLNDIFSRFDKLVEKYDLEKIKTIGDAYMAAGGVPVVSDNHTEKMARLALDMLQEIDTFEINGQKLNVRIGFHTGTVVAGVIGTRKFSYDIWGDAVNIASRLESHSAAGKIHISHEVYTLLKDKFNFEHRGNIPIKGKGNLETYFLTGIEM